MNELKIFENPMFGKIRVTMMNGEPWFVAADVCKALEIGNPSQAVTRLDDDERDTLISNEGATKGRPVNVVNEPGLYGLVLASRKKEAKAFKRWITHDVLPSIRKHGAYMTPQTLDRIISDPDFGIRLLTELKTEREQKAALQAENAALTETNAALEAQIEADAPRVMWAKVAEGSKDGMLIREFVKFLRPLGIVIGEKRMFADLREKGYLIKAEGRDHNKPTQKAMELGLFTVKERLVSTPDGESKLVTTPLLTEKGKQYFTKMYLARNALTVNAAATV